MMTEKQMDDFAASDHCLEVSAMHVARECHLVGITLDEFFALGEQKIMRVLHNTAIAFVCACENTRQLLAENQKLKDDNAKLIRTIGMIE